MTKTIKAPLHGFILAATTSDQQDAVMDFMKGINGRSKSHVVRYFTEFEAIAKMAEGYLDHAKVSKKDRIGCTASYSDAGPDSKSYDYAMTVNHVQLRRYAEGWRLMDARKIDVRYGHKGGISVRVPGRYIEALKVAAIKGATKGLTALPTRKPKPRVETDPAMFREENGRFTVGDFVTRDGTDVHQCVSLPSDYAFHGTFRCVVAPSRGWTTVGEDEVNSCHRYDPVEYSPEATLEPVTENGWFNPTADVVDDHSIAIAQFDHFTSTDDAPHLMTHVMFNNCVGRGE